MEKNGLKLLQIESDTAYPEIKIDNFERFLESISIIFKEDGFVIAYLDYKVLIGKYQNKEFRFYNEQKFDLSFVKKIRIFNENKELHIWKQGSSLKARLRVDKEGKSTNAVDVNQVIWGTDMHPLENGFTTLTEERGTEIIVPFENLAINDKKNRLAILTRNYIKYNDNGQATYNDVRFVQFMNFSEKNGWEVL